LHFVSQSVASEVEYSDKDVSLCIRAFDSVSCKLLLAMRPMKSETPQLAWANSIDAWFESTEHAKSMVEDGVVGGSKSREDAELIVELELHVEEELIVELKLHVDEELIVESSGSALRHLRRVFARLDLRNAREYETKFASLKASSPAFRYSEMPMAAVESAILGASIS
jgi:hypothetical protein